MNVSQKRPVQVYGEDPAKSRVLSSTPGMFPKRTTLECTGVGKRFDQGETCEDVLRDVNLTVQVGEACCLLGPSGSGKTTLLSILGCLLTPTTGRLVVDDTAVDFTVTHQVAELRRRRIGFVF